MVRDPENLVYVREEVGGYLVGGFEPNPKAWRLDDALGVHPAAAPGEWELFEPLLAEAVRRFPAVERPRSCGSSTGLTASRRTATTRSAGARPARLLGGGRDVDQQDCGRGRRRTRDG